MMQQSGCRNGGGGIPNPLKSLAFLVYGAVIFPHAYVNPENANDINGLQGILTPCLRGHTLLFGNKLATTD